MSVTADNAICCSPLTFGQYPDAWNYTQATEAMPFIAPGLGLGAPSKVSHWLKDFPMEVPFAK